MRFSLAASAVLAFATSAFAQAATKDFNPINVPGQGEKVQAGSTFNVKWQVPPKYQNVNVKIELLGGNDPNTLVPLSTIATGVPNSRGEYSWAVGSSLGDKKTYGLRFTNEASPGIFQYSMPFQITGGKPDDKKDDKKDDYKQPTHTVSTTGFKTVTLTNCESSTSAPLPPVPSSIPHGNATHIYTHVPVPHTSTVVHTEPAYTQPGYSQPAYSQPAYSQPAYSQPANSEPGYAQPSAPVGSPMPTPPPSAGSSALVAGPVALFGGLALAILAL